MLTNGPETKISVLLSHNNTERETLKIILGRGLIVCCWHEIKLAQQIRIIDETFPNIFVSFLVFNLK
jgi:hypothetical protein